MKKTLAVLITALAAVTGGRQLARQLRRPVVRLRHTETQTHLHSRAKRVENLRDAFGRQVRRRRGARFTEKRHEM